MSHVEVDRLQGDGAVRLSDGTRIPAGYDVRVLDARQRLGTRWVPTGFESYTVNLAHGGALKMPADGIMFLVMGDSRQLELLATSYNPRDGVTAVTATGGILSVEPPAQ